MKLKIGIASVVLAILGFGFNLDSMVLALLISGLLASVSYGSGYKYGIVAVIINLINIIFFSSSLWVVSEIRSFQTGGVYASEGSFFLIIQFVALVFLVTKQALYKRKMIRRIQFRF